MQQKIKYSTDEYGNVYPNQCQIEPAGGTACYNPRTETIDEPFEPDEGKRLIVDNGKFIQIAISLEHIKDSETGKIRAKNQNERYRDGLDVIPKGMKIETVDGKPEPIAKTLEEQLKTNEITQSEYNGVKNIPIMTTLETLDIKSVRSLREWLTKQEGCPEFLKNYEKEATAKRAELLK